MSVKDHVIWNKQDAWNSQIDEKYVPIKDMKDYALRRRWFHTRNCCTFSTFLVDKLPPDVPHTVLTIGVYEGAQEIWLMQNCLKHPDSRLICIDPWMSVLDGKEDDGYMEQCRQNAINNLSQWRRQVTLIRGFSQEVLTKAHSQGALEGVDFGLFDLVIIDGDHHARAVYQDAVLTFGLLKVGGWQLFDDVRNQKPKKHHVKEGLEQYLLTRPDDLKFVWSHRFCDCYERVK